jgi:Zn finger protein HypA/HybF involved in hydrogenase expression
MISTAESAVCAHCYHEKPAAEFRPNARKANGLDSWCQECFREYHQDYHSRRPSRVVSPHSGDISENFQRGDAVEFSRAVCEHIAWYITRKINEFEAAHFIEAPPHLTAIHAIAKSMVAQHPRPTTNRGRGRNASGLWDITCHDCGQVFEARSPTIKYCNTCKGKRRKEGRSRYRSTEAAKAARRLQAKRKRERERQPITIRCQRCGTTVAAKSVNRKYCADCADQVRREYARSQYSAERAKKYRQSPEAKARHREYMRRYSQTERGKEVQRRARQAYKQRQREEKALRGASCS